MLRFPIEWRVGSLGHRNGQSRLELDKEWTLSFNWKLTGNPHLESYTLESIEIQRKTASEVSSIYGTFSLLEDHIKISTQNFSKLLDSGSAFTKLVDLKCKVPELRDGWPADYSLHGFVNIASFIGNCDFETRDCKFCCQPKSLMQLSGDFAKLLDPQSSCEADVNLRCGSFSMPAHKLILSARSPVFSAMFKNQMKESQENEVVIADIEAPVLQAMVTYIYSGKTPGLTEELASDLLFAAEKYQLPDLKSDCCVFLKGFISKQNVIKFIYLGDMFAKDLISYSVEYLSQNYKTFAEIEKLEDWKTMIKEKPALVIHILTSLLKSKDKKKE